MSPFKGVTSHLSILYLKSIVY